MTTFTGRKLDLTNAVCFDRSIRDYAKFVMSVIVSHLNEKTGHTKLSDETIAFESGGASRRKVIRARKELQRRWLTWQRTLTANIYSANSEAAAPFGDAIRRDYFPRFLEALDALREPIADAIREDEA